MSTAAASTAQTESIDAYATLRASLDDLMAAAETFTTATRHVPDLDVHDAVSLLKDLREVVNTLRQADAGMFVRHLDYLLRHSNGPVEVEGVATVEVARSKNRRAWQHDAATRDWANAYLISTGGEVPDPFELLRAFRSAAQISGWKVGALREIGLDVDDYCDSTPGAPSVRFI